MESVYKIHVGLIQVSLIQAVAKSKRKELRLRRLGTTSNALSGSRERTLDFCFYSINIVNIEPDERRSRI